MFSLNVLRDLPLLALVDNLPHSAMRFPRSLSRLLFSSAVIAISLVSKLPARANHEPGSNPVSSDNSKTERLVVTPSNLGFGRVAVGRRKLRTVTMTNWGNSEIRLLQVITRGDSFDVAGLELPITLSGGESYTFSGVFSPRFKGASRGSVAFISDASGVSNPVPSLELTGVGTNDGEELSINPPPMNFGVVEVGLGESQTGNLTAGAGQVTIYSALSTSVEFTWSGLSLPVTIPQGASQGFTVTFTPQGSGTASATLSFLDENGNPLAVEPLNGTGTSSQNHRVSLSWTASTSQNVIGYNVYRGNHSGGPYSRINSTLDPSTTYTDESVVDGNTYYYVTRAIDSDYEESGYSNQAQAKIPRLLQPPRDAESRGPHSWRKVPLPNPWRYGF